MLRNQCLWEALTSPFSKTQACTTLADKQIYLFHVINYCVLFFIFFLFLIHPTHQVIISFPCSLFGFYAFFRQAVSTDFIHWSLGLSSNCKTRFFPFRKNLRSSGRKLSCMFSMNIDTILLSHQARLFFCQIWSLSCRVSFLFTHMFHWVL